MANTLVHIEWDRIGRSPTCVTVDGKPILASAIKLEWPGDRGTAGCLPTLTLTQVILPIRRDHVAEVTTTGYLVPCDQWDAYQAWCRQTQTMTKGHGE